MKKAFASGLVLVAAMLFAAPLVEANPKPQLNPVIFVHGGAGSGAQFESQKLRFTANGYPDGHVTVLEYDSTFSINSMADVHARLDQLVADVTQQTGRAQVDILGHSLGTTVMHGYLSTPARAANVGHYVNIDGRTATSPPGGVPTLAIWAGVGAPGRQIVGATNVTLPNQTHVESATSAEAFAEMYEFFTGTEPVTSGIVPSPGNKVTVAGRAVIFPQNVGVQDATLEVWRLDAATGRRLFKKPAETLAIGGDGSWGPIAIRRGEHYELALLRNGARTHRYYFEPFLRDDHLVRLLTSLPGQGTDGPIVSRSDRHTALGIIRYKELWGDQGAGSDVVEINGVNVCNAATCPRSKLVVGVVATDAGSDGVTDLSAPIPALFAQPFQTGVDVFVPATAPATGTVSVRLTPRGGGPARTVSFPNFPSSTDRVTVQLNDFG